MKKIKFSDVHYIIFSKDRPIQLYSLLESIETIIKANSIEVIYSASSEFIKGYKQVFDRFPVVKKIKETDFSKNTREAVARVQNSYIAFLVDDDIFYKNPPRDYFIPNNEILCFSPRLGINHNYCQPANKRYDSLYAQGIQGDIEYSWYWKNMPFDLGYPFSLDGNIFKTELIKEAFNIIREFSNPNTLEDSLMYFNPLMHKVDKTKISAFKESFLINLPMNRVNLTHTNTAGEITTNGGIKELNEQFLLGLKIDWLNMKFNNIKECHKEIDLVFTYITE